MASPKLRIASDRLFLLIAPFLYVAYALLTPPFQTPDEHQHLFRAWQLSELQVIGERHGDQVGGELPESLGRAALPELGTLEPHVRRPVVKRPFHSLFGRATPVSGSPTRFYNFLGSALYSPAGYIPQMAAIWFGKAAGFSVENIVRLGRMLNAALAIVLIFFAIQVIPFGKNALLWVGLLPMTAATSAAFGQDGLIVGSACLITAIGLRVTIDGRWNRPRILVTAALAIILGLSKLFYLPLALVGGQPVDRGRFEWRRVIAPLIICMFAAALTALWLHSIAGLVIPARPEVPPLAVRLQFWLRNPMAPVAQLFSTYTSHGVELIQSMFTFGWQNIWADRRVMFLSFVALALVLLAGGDAAASFGWNVRLWLLLIAASVVLLISLALDLYWTLPSESWIHGLQGRYFIPASPPFIVALLPKRGPVPRLASLVPLLMIGANIVALDTIVRAFFG